MESEISELSSHVMVKQKQKKEKNNGAAGQKKVGNNLSVMCSLLVVHNSLQGPVHVRQRYCTIPWTLKPRTDALQRYGECESSQSDCFVIKIVITLFLRTANQITCGHVGPWHENEVLRLLKAPPVSHDCHHGRPDHVDRPSVRNLFTYQPTRSERNVKNINSQDFDQKLWSECDGSNYASSLQYVKQVCLFKILCLFTICKAICKAR